MSQDDQRARTLQEALNFLEADGWVISAVKDSDVPRVMVEFSASEYQRGYEAGLEAAAQVVNSAEIFWIANGINRRETLAAIRALPRKG